jgi:hypothetical protein
MHIGFLNRNKNFRILTSLLVVLIVIGIGTILLIYSHAATSVNYASLQASNGTLTNGAKIVSNCNDPANSSCVLFEANVPPPTTLNTVPRIIYSMEPPHEGSPHGVPTSYAWQAGPVVTRPIPPSGMTATTAWGQIYADSTTSEPSNVRIEIKNMECYLWSISDKQWVRLQAYKTVVGGHYLEDFATNKPISADLRVEPDGGISTTMISGYNFHFYPSSRAAIANPADIGAAFTTYQARIIMDDPSGPDNISKARYLANAGGDWWKNTSIAYGGPLVNNSGIGQGRFTYLSGNWQAEDFYSGGPTASGVANAWTESQLTANPPALDGMGAP